MPWCKFWKYQKNLHLRCYRPKRLIRLLWHKDRWCIWNLNRSSNI